MNVLIVAGLNDFGGVEIEVDLLMHLCVANGNNVHVLSTKHLSKKSVVRRQAQDHPKISISAIPDYFSETFLGRFFFILGGLKNRLSGANNTSKDREAFGYRFAKYFKNFFWVGGIGKTLIDQCDLVVIIGQPHNNFLGVLNYSKQVDKKVYLRLTGTVFKSHPENIHYNKFIKEINYLRAIIVHSHHSAGLVKDILGYCGSINIIDQCTQEEKALLAIEKSVANEQQIIFGTMARLSPEKRIKDIIIAFAQLVAEKKNISFEFHIAGNGSEMIKLKKLVDEKGVADKVRFLGYLDNKVKINFFSTIDVFIISSQVESGPVTGIEAMASGLPIISTDVGAMSERLAGISPSLFYQSGNIAELLSYMKLAIDISVSKNQAYSNQIRQRYVSMYAKKQILSKYKAVLF